MDSVGHKHAEPQFVITSRNPPADYIFDVNELNIATLLYRIITKCSVASVSVRCFTLVGQALIKPLIRRLLNKKLIKEVVLFTPSNADEQSFYLLPWRIYIASQSDYSENWRALAKSEGVILQLGAVGTRQAQNGWLTDYLYKQQYCSAIATHLASYTHRPCVFSGLQAHNNHKTLTGIIGSLTSASAQLRRLVVVFTNSINLLTVITVALVFLLLRVRYRVKKTMVNFAAYPRIWDYHSPSLTKLIQHSKIFCYDPESPAAAQFCLNSGVGNLAYFKDTVIHPSAVPQYLVTAIYYVIQDYIQFLTYNPIVCKNLLLCRFKEAVYQNFFHQYQTKYLFCTADYIPDHAIRSAALRQTGGKSIGIAHGLANYAPYPNWQFLDYDLYFGLSLNLYEKDYSGTWSKNMVFQAIQTPHFERDHSRVFPKSNAVTWFLHQELEENWMVDQIRILATELPGHQIYIRPRPTLEAHLKSMLEKISQLQLSNIDMITADPSYGSYDLLERSKYCITTGSTMTIEAIQFNTIPFCLDFHPDLVNFFYRRYPFVCYSTISSITSRICEIETDPDTFSWQAYAGLADITAPALGDTLTSLIFGTPAG